MIYRIDSKNFQDIKNILQNKVKEIFTKPNSEISDQICRIEIQISNIDLLSWLDNQKIGLKVYWSDRKQRFEMAGIGEAYKIQGESPDNYTTLFQQIKDFSDRSDPGLRFYGGISFNKNARHDKYWHRFGDYYFLIPRFELVREGEKLFFVCNFINESQNHRNKIYNELLHDIEKLSFDLVTLPDLDSELLERINYPEKDDWFKMIKSALALIEKGEVEKIVLARKSKLKFSSNLNALSILNQLKNINPGSTHFCFQPEHELSFIGSTPELMYSRLGKQIYSEAIAGTRPRGEMEDEDKKLEQELLSSNKDVQEHKFVLQSVKEIFNKFCSKYESNGRISVLKLARLQHLFANFNGILKNNVTDAELISALHPTPAVGGYPTESALSKIDLLEPFERGWYAAPIGWISDNSAEFAVAIRSGLVKGNELVLYSGAGIVTGSQPQSEWEELENKIANFKQIFDINGELQDKYQQSLGLSDYRRTC